MKVGGHPHTGPLHVKLAIFGTGLALGSFLIGAVSLPFFFVYNSVKAAVEIVPQAPKAAAGADPDDFIEGNYWALIIGINKYPAMDKDKQLEAARKDAEAVSKLLVERYGFSKERMVELYDESGSRKGIIRAFSSLKRRLKDKDSLFIYYAGHGEYEKSATAKTAKEQVDGMGYWIPSDAELDDPASYVFNSQVRDYLANIPARHIYAVVDSCFSGSLMGRSRQLGLSKSAIKELYQLPSRWILASGGLYPVPDAADKSKQGHSTFAWHFMKLLRQNTNPYLLAKDLAEPIAVRVSNEVKDQLPRSAPVVAAGDEGGQFVFKLKKEFQRGADLAQAIPDLNPLEKQLRDAEEALKKQQEEFEKRKQALLDRLKKTTEEQKRQQEEQERQLAELERKEKDRTAQENEERLKAEAEKAERAKKNEEERLAAAKKFEQEQKEREQKAREAELARKKIEEERKAEEARLAALKRDTEERKKQEELARKKAEEERKAEEARLAAELKKREEAEKARLKEEQQKMAELRKKQEAEKDAARLAELKRQEEEARQAEEARRKAEEEKIAEQKRQAEERERQRQAELKRQEEEREAEEARLAEEKRKAEERESQRQAELKRQEEERKRLEAEKKAAQEAEQKQLAELKKKQEAEERRIAEEKRKAEEKRLAEEKTKTEAEKLAALKRQQEEEAKRKAEEERVAATLKREAEEQKRLVEEAKKKAEEAKKAAEQAAQSAPPSEAPKSGSEPIVEATLRPFQAPKAKDPAALITIPAGEFVMGSKAGDGQPDESPQRAVYLDAYTIDKYEVTVEQYAAYLKKSGAEPPDFWERVNQKEDGNRPVVGVDWLDSKDFCEYYGKQLPTEAQWEKAARGTDGRKYPWGSDDPGPLFANFASGVSFSYSKSLAAVGSYESGKSPYGVYDMVGNVWEWVLDNYDKAYYQVATAKNPAGPASADYKVIRGGSWSKRPAVARSAGRMYVAPSTRSNSLGFRCVGEAK